MKVKVRERVAREREYGHLGIGHPEVVFGVHGKSVTTLVRGLQERVFLQKDGTLPYRPDKKHVQLELGRFYRICKRRLPLVVPITTDEFLGYYTGQRRGVYERAISIYQSVPFSGLKKYFNLNTFVKAEKLNLTAKPDPAPRVIQPRHPVANVALGIFIKPIEFTIYRIVDSVFGETTICKGLNSMQVGELIATKFHSFSTPCAVGLDASRFDQHVSSEILKYEHRFYKTMYRNPFMRQHLSTLLRYQLVNHGFGYCDDGKVEYSVKGCRMSGDMNTALGNCLIMCAMVWSFFDSVKFPQSRWKLVNNGDDCVIFLDHSDLPILDGISAYLESLGFPTEVEVPVFECEKVVFCQCQPVFDGHTWRAVRDPRITLAKDALVTTPFTTKLEWERARSAIGECGLALAGDMPVVGAYYNLLTCGGQSTWVEGGMAMLARGMSNKFSSPTEEARYSFAKAFGIYPDAQLAIECFYSSFELFWPTRLGKEVQYHSLPV